MEILSVCNTRTAYITPLVVFWNLPLMTIGSEQNHLCTSSGVTLDPAVPSYPLILWPCTGHTSNVPCWAGLWLSTGNKRPCPSWRVGSSSLQLCPASSHLHRSCTHLHAGRFHLLGSHRADVLKESQSTGLWGCSWRVAAFLESTVPDPALALCLAIEKTLARPGWSPHTSGGPCPPATVTALVGVWRTAAGWQPQLWPGRREKVSGDFHKGQIEIGEWPA